MLRKFKFKLFGTKIYEKQRIFLSLKLKFLKNYVHKKIYTKKMVLHFKNVALSKSFPYYKISGYGCFCTYNKQIYTQALIIYNVG